jgi:hypothetical protein
MKAIPGFTAESSVYRTNSGYFFRPSRARRNGSQQVIPQGGLPGTSQRCVLWYYYDVNYPGVSWPILICW